MTVSLLEACDDASLFNFPLWDGQRQLLEEFEEAQRSGDWLAVWCIGRRSGKSTLAALVGLHSALLRPDLDALDGSTGGSHVVCIATNLRQARSLIQVASEIVNASPLLRSMLLRETLDALTFQNGVVFTALPATGRGGRGRAVRALVMDEAAHMLDNDVGSSAEASEVFAAMIPSTAQFQGLAPVIVASTPSGDANWFAGLVRSAESGELEHARAYRASSASMNPTLTAAFMESEERRDASNYRGEYLAELVGSGGAFLEPELVDNAVAARAELGPLATTWIAGFDPSFSRDPAALVLVGRSPETPDRLLVGLVRTWQPLKQRRTQGTDERRLLEDRLLAEVADICVQYKVETVVTDGYLAEVVHTALRQRGLWVESYALTTQSKTTMFSGVKARLAAGSIELYDEPTLPAELKRLRSTFKNGHRSIETPRLAGSHCDSAVALGLAVQHLDAYGRASGGLPIVVDVSEPGPIFGLGEPRRRETVADLRNRVF